MVGFILLIMSGITNIIRTLHRSPPQPTTGAAAHSPDFGRPWPGLRIAELQAIDKGPDDGEAGLSQRSNYAKRYKSYTRHGFRFPCFEARSFFAREIQNGVSIGRRSFGSVYYHVYTLSCNI
jgi:hypothetical protein